MYITFNELLKRWVSIITLFIVVIHTSKNSTDFALKANINSSFLSKYEISLIICHKDPIDLKSVLEEELDNMNNGFTLYPSVTPSVIVGSSVVDENVGVENQQPSQVKVQPTIPSVIDATVKPTNTPLKPTNPPLKPTNPPLKPTNQTSTTQDRTPQVSHSFPVALTSKPIRERPTKFASLSVPSFRNVPYNKMPRVIKELWKDSEKIDYIHDGLFEFAYPKTRYKGKAGYTYYSLSEAIDKYQVKNSILLMLTDLGYLEQFWNTYLYGNFTQYKNLVVACINQEVYEILTDRGVQVAFVDTSYDSKEIKTKSFTDQESPAFKTKLQWKLNIILAALECQVEVLYMDSDIFLLRNPFPFLSSYHGYDFVAQKDITVCSGFMYFWPTSKSMRMLDVARKIRAKINGGDQLAILKVLENIHDIKYGLLPPTLFMSGETFFDKYQYYWNQIDKNIFMYHNNYVRGKVFKEYRAKEMRSLVIERDKDYSNKDARYFTIFLVHSKKKTLFGVDQKVHSVISAGIQIANQLKRHFVIPPITCGQNEESYCNVCFFEYVNCFNKALKQTLLPFKESIFFADNRVPLSIRTAFNQSVVYNFQKDCHASVIQSKFPAYKDLKSNVVCKHCPSGNLKDCIIKTFMNSTEPVIKVFTTV